MNKTIKWMGVALLGASVISVASAATDSSNPLATIEQGIINISAQTAITTAGLDITNLQDQSDYQKDLQPLNTQLDAYYMAVQAQNMQDYSGGGNPPPPPPQLSATMPPLGTDNSSNNVATLQNAPTTEHKNFLTPAPSAVKQQKVKTSFHWLD